MRVSVTCWDDVASSSPAWWSSSALPLLIGVAQSGTWLIAARALQGIGAAIVAPSALSLLTASFPEGKGRSKAVALYGATAGIGASLGLVVGGATASWVSWRAGFFINLPIGAAMIALAPKYLPETPPRSGTFDLRGALLATCGTGALVYGVIESAPRGWSDPVVVTALKECRADGLRRSRTRTGTRLRLREVRAVTGP